MKDKVYEWCPFCEYENEYEIDENTWIAKCESCGRPILLCNKCYPHDKCGCCSHEKKLLDEMKKWEKEQIGKIVYWKEDTDEKSDYCKVVDFDDDCYILKHLFLDCEEMTFRAFDCDMEFLDKNEMIDKYISFFKSKNFLDNTITL